MYRVIDADGHIFEWQDTFADRYLDEEYHHRRPVIVEGPQQLHWLVDNVIYPGLYGKGGAFQGSPVSRGDMRRDSLVPKPESLDCLEIRTPVDRLALQSAEGIDASVLYPTLFLMRPLSVDTRFEAALCRSYNNWMRDVCAPSNGQLLWVAVVDLNNPLEAAEEVRRAKQLGAVGVMAPGMVGVEGIASPRFEPFWAAAQEENLAVGVHVAYCTPLDTFGFVFSLLMGFEHVLASGLLDKFPRLRLAFLEASCNWVPFMIERLDEKNNPERRRFAPTRPLDTVLDRPEVGGYSAELSAKEYIDRGNLYFGFEVEDPLLAYCIDHFGDECWLFASDIPHGDRLAKSALILQDRVDLTEDAKRKLVYDNVVRFYDLRS
jgi:predicted TIM-barrel fold metal-dependent hydrolase